MGEARGIWGGMRCGTAAPPLSHLGKGERSGEGVRFSKGHAFRIRRRSPLTCPLPSVRGEGRSPILSLFTRLSDLVGPRVKPEDRDVEPEPLGLRTCLPRT